MRDQVLSIKQMQHLKELGVDTSNASMCWVKDPNSEDRKISIHDEYCYEMSCLRPVPTFTLQDILNIMPKELKIKVETYRTPVDCSLMLDVANDRVYYECFVWQQYDCVKYFNSVNLITSAYEMLCWLAENKLLGKEEKK